MLFWNFLLNTFCKILSCKGHEVIRSPEPEKRDAKAQGENIDGRCSHTTADRSTWSVDYVLLVETHALFSLLKKCKIV